jgi:predicted PurR-regulated permease PerM
VSNASSARVDYWTAGVVAAGLLVILYLHLVSALLAGLLVHELVHAVAPRITFGRMGRAGSRLLTVGLIAALVIAALTGVVLLGVAVIHSDAAGPGDLLARLADIIDASRPSLPERIGRQLPEDAEALRVLLVGWMHEHAKDVQQVGTSFGRGIGHVAFGAVIGALICVREVQDAGPSTRLVASFEQRLSTLARAFRRIVFAQLKISVVNTTLTAVYLSVVLPALGVHLPLRKTMIAITFVAGLLPIIGNLVSNSVIVIVSLSSSLWTAAAALVFLVLLHKLEYLLNARIVGHQINAAAWELLSVMVILEAAFGVPGLIAAPIFYAYLKDELKAFDAI